MKNYKALFSFSLLLIILSHFACNKDEEINQILISVGPATNIIESGFTVNWQLNEKDIKEVSVDLSSSESFGTDTIHIVVPDVNQTSLTINDLNGATTYYYKINVLLKDETSVVSEINSATTSYETLAVKIITSDGINLAANLKYLASNKEKKPGIVFMHELRAIRNNWNDAEVVQRLIAKGYVCLILDFRGHFLSDKVTLPTEPSQFEPFFKEVSNDLTATIEFMKSNELVDGENSALVGGSMGGIMAIAGNGYEEVRSSVALSGLRLGTLSIFPSLIVKSTFFIAAENDISPDYNFAEEATKMYDISHDPKKLKIIPNSDEHGTILLTVPGLNDEIIEWIDAGFMEN